MAIKGFGEEKTVGQVIENSVLDSNNYGINHNMNDSIETFNIDDQIDDVSNDASQKNVINDINNFINYYDTEDLALASLKGIENPIDVSDLPGGYRFQGFTYTDNYIYITAYDHKKNSHESSVVLVYDHKGNYLGKMFLPKGAGGDSHVGGVSFDSKHNILYITGKNGDVLALNNKLVEETIKSYSDISNDTFDFSMDDYDHFRIEDFVINNQDINLLNSIPKEIQDYLSTTGDNLNAASVYYDETNQKLYVPTFSANSKVYVFDVEFDSDGKPTYKYDKIYGINEATNSKVDDVELPPGIQGVSIYTDNKGEQYLLTASSFGSNDSVIVKYKVNEDGSLSFSGQKVLEGIKGAENMMIDGKKIYFNVENDVSGSHHQDGGTFYSFDIEKDIIGSIDDKDYQHAIKKLSSSASDYDNR